jgi:hypothetical protein
LFDGIVFPPAGTTAPGRDTVIVGDRLPLSVEGKCIIILAATDEEQQTAGERETEHKWRFMPDKAR